MWILLLALLPQLSRGPYIQDVRPDAVTIVWRSSAPSSLTWGSEKGTSRSSTLEAPQASETVVTLRGLDPYVRYTYEVTAGSESFQGAFWTALPVGDTSPFRFAAWGDSGNGSHQQADNAANLRDLDPPAELVTLLGDVVYPAGAWHDWDAKFFAPYRQYLANAPIYGTLGNHDANTAQGAPFKAAFHHPRASGATPSQNELWYSFDYGIAHFVSFSMYGANTSVGGTQWTWVMEDIADAAARGQRWIIAFTHACPYSNGGHDSTSESTLVFLEDAWVPEMEARGLDLMLSGHSHNYERTYVLRNGQVIDTNVMNPVKEEGPGAMYVVSGCAGKTNDVGFHPLIPVTLGDEYGISVFDVSWGEISGHFLRCDGSVFDQFTYSKP